MRVLIVGGTGLISTAITRELLDRGHTVVHYNRGKSEVRVGSAVERITGDRRDYATFESRVSRLGPWDAVIDMVCFEPDEARSLIRATRDSTRQVVFCSTVDVYDKPTPSLPIREDHPRGGVTDYGKKKKECEDILLEAHVRGEINLTVIRPAHTYGEGGTLIHTMGWGTYMLDRMRRGMPIIVHGDGNSLWVSCHIDDVARAFTGALANEAALGKCYNVTGEEWMTWDQYHERIAKAMGKELPRLVHIPVDLLWKTVPEYAGAARWNFMFNNLFDNSLAKRELGFEYRVCFVEGARRTIEWLESHGRIEDASVAPWYDRLIEAWDRKCEELVRAWKQQ